VVVQCCCHFDVAMLKNAASFACPVTGFIPDVGLMTDGNASHGFDFSNSAEGEDLVDLIILS
jgi:hypothetical protein